MINIMIHTPVISRGFIVNHIKDKIPTIKKEIGEEIRISSPHDYETEEHGIDNWLKNCIKDNNMPDIMLTHASDFSILDNYDDISKYFAPLSKNLYEKYPISDEYKSYVDNEGFFYPLFFVSMLIAYNSEKIEKNNLKSSWQDLIDFKKRTIITSDIKPPTKVVGAYLLKNNPEYMEEFMKLDRVNSPIMVIKQLQHGNYDIALTNSIFAITGKTDKIEINYPKENLGILPQLIMFKKGSSDKCLKMADILFDKQLLEMITRHTFICPVKNAKNEEKLSSHVGKWCGYKEFVNNVKEFEKYVNGGR